MPGTSLATVDDVYDKKKFIMYLASKAVLLLVALCATCIASAQVDVSDDYPADAREAATLSMRGDPPRAEWMQRVFNPSPLEEECRQHLRVLHEAQHRPDDPWLWYLQGLIGFRIYGGPCYGDEKSGLNRLMSAEQRERSLKQAIVLAPKFQAAWAGLVHHYIKSNQIETANTTFATALREVEQPIGLELELAKVALLMAQGKYQAVVNTATLLPSSLRVRARFLSRAHDLLGDCESARLHAGRELPCTLFDGNGADRFRFIDSANRMLEIATPNALLEDVGNRDKIEIGEALLALGADSAGLRVWLANLYIVCANDGCNNRLRYAGSPMALEIPSSARYFYSGHYQIPNLPTTEKLQTDFWLSQDTLARASLHLDAAEKQHAPAGAIAYLRVQAAGTSRSTALAAFVAREGSGLLLFDEYVKSRARKRACSDELVKQFTDKLEHSDLIRSDGITPILAAFGDCQPAIQQTIASELLSGYWLAPGRFASSYFRNAYLQSLVRLLAKQNMCDGKLMSRITPEYRQAQNYLEQSQLYQSAKTIQHLCMNGSSLFTQLQQTMQHAAWHFPPQGIAVAPPHEASIGAPDHAESGEVLQLTFTGHWDTQQDPLESIEVFLKYPKSDFPQWVQEMRPASRSVIPYWSFRAAALPGLYNRGTKIEVQFYIRCQQHGAWVVKRNIIMPSPPGGPCCEG